MYTPLVCTANSLGNIDYGIPIIANKSTDYRTATTIGVRFLPSAPQEFDVVRIILIRDVIGEVDCVLVFANIGNQLYAGWQKFVRFFFGIRRIVSDERSTFLR